jgi:hypothetical protein
MRTLGLFSILFFVLGLAVAAAEELRVNRQELRSDPSAPDTLAFTVSVKSPGSYAVQLLARALEGKEYTLLLTLQPEGSPAGDADAVLNLRFTFTGQGCG